MECQNIEWSSTRRELSNILQISNYVQDWPQRVTDSLTHLVFQASSALITNLSMTSVFLSLCLQSWIIYIQWYVFRTWFVVTMPTDIAFILGCAVFMKLSWINQVSQALMVDHGLDWFTSDLFQPNEFREMKAYLPIKNFKLRKLFEQLLVIEVIF